MLTTNRNIGMSGGLHAAPIPSVFVPFVIQKTQMSNACLRNVMLTNKIVVFEDYIYFSEDAHSIFL